MKIGVGVMIMTVLISFVAWKIIPAKGTAISSSIKQEITSVIENAEVDSSLEKESRIVVEAEVTGIIRKVFVEKNNLVESDKVIAMISRMDSRSKNHDYVIVRSPGAGKLSRVIVHEGDTVERGDKLFEMLLPGE